MNTRKVATSAVWFELPFCLYIDDGLYELRMGDKIGAISAAPRDKSLDDENIQLFNNQVSQQDVQQFSVLFNVSVSNKKSYCLAEFLQDIIKGNQQISVLVLYLSMGINLLMLYAGLVLILAGSLT